ncbi:MAG TPA: protein FdrA [Candidatus Dormibacteraeota bacterium]|nr:protein FdrA [Candidatus Dormibacteraeota bacterium]
MSRRLRSRRGTYMDSIRLMSATRTMQSVPGVAWAAAVMATPAVTEELAGRGFPREDLDGAGAEDLLLAVEAHTDGEAEAALIAAEEALEAEQAAASTEWAAEQRPRTLREALTVLPGANLALVSVPGPYAALEAGKALSAGLHVLLFSDNVPLEAEVELKSRAAELGLLLMGPGAGTAMLGGTGVGFANVVTRGRVGIVAAAGTGAQEVMCLLDRWGAGISHVIGVGGRDVSIEVGGRMASLALSALNDDEGTDALLLVSKPPAPEVARSLLREGRRDKPLVAALLGLADSPGDPPELPLRGVGVCRSLEGAALSTVRILGLPRPRLGEGLAPRAAAAMSGLGARRRAVRGLFSGGTLCHEAMLLLRPHLGALHSNVPLHPQWRLPAPEGAHVLLDLGDEEFTRGRPHPMIDPVSRVPQLLEAARDSSTAAILMDVVLGHGSHPDPAGVLAPVCGEIVEQDDGPAVVAYVLGTDRDPQGYTRQRERLERAGCLVPPTAARAALLAGAIAVRRPELAESEPS